VNEAAARAFRFLAMKKPLRLFFPLALVGAFALGHIAHTDTGDDQFNLAQYRAALTQLGAGNAPGAQVTLENAAERVPLAGENALLLAYLQDRAGQTDAARQTLENVESPSPLATLYLGRIGGGVPIAVAAQPKNDNPARLQNSDARIAKLEKLVFNLVNQERVSRGLNELTWSDDLAEIGRAHAAEMRDKKYFAHESPTPALRDPLNRYVAATGRTPRLVAENIYRAWGSRSFVDEADLKSAHQALMDSPGHRSNILLGSANSLGVGLVANSSGDIWLDEMFSRP